MARRLKHKVGSVVDDELKRRLELTAQREDRSEGAIIRRVLNSTLPSLQELNGEVVQEAVQA